MHFYGFEGVKNGTIIGYEWIYLQQCHQTWLENPMEGFSAEKHVYIYIYIYGGVYVAMLDYRRVCLLIYKAMKEYSMFVKYIYIYIYIIVNIFL
jgi:hypothetical protein